jgi:multidrug resistance efflux pump
VHPGDPARITLIGYPDLPITGPVDSLSHGIMDANAAPGVAGLPNGNPVFTWVRLAQCIPVRINIEQSPDELHLAAGVTATMQVRP